MLLTVQTVLKTYQTGEGRVTVLDGLSLSLAAGQSLALTGESGSGKSTLLHLIAGLDRVDQGSISLNGTRITDASDTELARIRRSSIGLIFQQFNLIPSLNVTDNMAFQARMAGRHDPAWQAELTQALGLGQLLTRFPEQLSGGQQQRVAIGRALALRPPLVLADEPTGNLDEATGDAVMDLMLSLVARSGASLLMVTHSPRLAARLDRTLRLSAGRIT